MTEEQIREMVEEVAYKGIAETSYKGWKAVIEVTDDEMARFTIMHPYAGRHLSDVVPIVEDAIRAAVVMIDSLESALQQDDALFHPEAEGWKSGPFFSWISPSGTWRCIDGRSPFALEKRGINGRWDRVYSPDSRDTPTRALVMMIIEQNGADA